MSIILEVEGWDKALHEMDSVLKALGDKQARKAVSQSMNRSLAQGRKVAAQIARKAYTAPLAKLFDNISIRRAKPGSLTAELTLESKPGVSLIHFKADPATPGTHPAAGVSVQIKRKGSRHVKLSDRGGSKPFIMKKKQGGYGVFVRHSKKKTDVEMLFGPAAIQALQPQEASRQVAAAISENFPGELAKQIDRLLGGKDK